MEKNNPMMEKYVTISWCPADIKAVREEWSDEKCMEVLLDVGGWLEDRSIELGWEVLETLLLDYDEEEE
jgi:hypothetical protein